MKRRILYIRRLANLLFDVPILCIDKTAYFLKVRRLGYLNYCLCNKSAVFS